MTEINSSPVGLVVPIRLEALLIGGGDAANDNYFLPAYANFQNLPYKGGGLQVPYLSNLALSQPFTGNKPLPQGIHLHWNLPRALRRGAYDQAGNLTLPKAPDRWLVTRAIIDASKPQQPVLTFKSWVVESNFQWPDATYSQTSIPQSATGAPRPYAFLGRVYDYEDWLQNGNKGTTYLDNLTAMGFGIPDFSSYYPNCQNVFGLLDQSLNSGFNPDTMSLSYMVTGWYQTPAHDPLNGKQISGANNEFGWLFDGDVFPAYSLYNAAVYKLPWHTEPKYSYFPNYRDSLSPDIVLGNTPMETLAALANKQLQGQGLSSVELILNALQLGVLQSLGKPGGLASIEDAIYNQSYASTDAGLLWDIVPKKSTPPPPPESTSLHPLSQLSGGLAGDLDQLNDIQDRIDRQQTVATSLRAQTFADWYKFMQIEYAADPTKYPALGDVYSFINAEIEALNNIVGTGGEIDQLQSQVSSLRGKIAAELPPSVELVSVAAPRYYEPNDPVLLLSGDGITLPPADESPTISCVLSSNLLSSIALPKDLLPDSSAVSLSASALPTIPQPTQLPYQAVTALVQSALLLDPGASSLIAALIAAQGGANNPATLNFGTTAQDINTAQGQYLAGQQPANGIIFTGTPPQPDIALRTWATPWHPIALSWQFNFFPLAQVGDNGADYPANFVLGNFDFDPSSFSYRLKAQDFSPVIQEYIGTILLSSDTSLSLRSEISRYLQYASDPELEEILQKLREYPLLAQSLGGFNASALMLNQTLQMPVADPIARTRIYYDFSNSTVPSAVGDQNRLAPMTSNAYNPLRAGKIVMTKIILIDEFGRYKSVDLSQLIVSETIPTTGDQPPALLPPLRVAQPTQLNFRWLSAANPAIETTSLPETNPICGWIVPNHLNSSLMFYDADGESIGTLTPSGDGQSLVWQVAPQAGLPSESMEQAFAGRNPVLATFAFSVRDNGPGYLPALIHTFDETQVFIGPQNYAQDNKTAVLLGSPLAIVQANLGMRMAGLPSPDQSFGAFRADITRGNPLVRTDQAFPDVRFPVLLGSLSELSDGLIGFFIQGAGPSTDFSRFFALAADGRNPHIVSPEAGTITLSPGDAQPQLIAMIIDPRCEVHASNGVDPVKALNIPADTYAQALDNMTFTFLTSPVLRTPGGFQLPIPTEADGNWKWVSYDQGAWNETDLIPVDPNATLRSPEEITEGWLKLTPKE
jgi:hypothetical protein